MYVTVLARDDLYIKKASLSDFLHREREQAIKSIANMPEDEFLSSSVEEIIDKVIYRHEIDLLVFGDIETHPVYEGEDGSFIVRQTIYFEGRSALLKYSPSRQSTTTPVGSILRRHPKQIETAIVIEAQNIENISEQEIAETFDKNTETIKRWAERANSEASQYNENLSDYVAPVVETRRTRLEHAKTLFNDRK